MNGIDEVHYLGDLEGTGGTYTVDIAPTRFDFSQENILYLELLPGNVQQNAVFGWLWPQQGRITGQVRLEGVSETTIDFTKTTVSFDSTKNYLVVHTALKHNMSLEHGPWVLSGVLKDKDEKVAECLLPLNANGEFEQTVDLVFELKNPKFWSNQDPFLYELNMVLTNSRGDFDSIQMPVGIGQYTSTAEKWVLNDKAIEVKSQILTWDQEVRLRNQQQWRVILRISRQRGIMLFILWAFSPMKDGFTLPTSLGSESGSKCPLIL